MTPEAEIRRRIRDRGPITFAEFMEVALYWPQGGYYRGNGQGDGRGDGRGDGQGDGGGMGEAGTQPFGSSGDYYTSPLVHPAFGALLAVQLYQFWQLLHRPNPFHVVELGAGNGLLCQDILTAAGSLPDGFRQSLNYLCLDLGLGRSLGRSRGLQVREVTAGALATDGVPLRNLRGCILSNELLDAFPVHQVRVERGELKEVHITLDTSPSGGGNGGEDFPLVEVLAEPSTLELAARLERLGIELAEGQTAEINLGLDRWAGEVAGALEAGFVLTIDYGRTAEELYSAEHRPRGSLTTFYRHTQTDAPLRNIGRQDITAQVDFTSLVDAGRRVGLEPLGYTTQAQFLRNLGLDWLRRRVTSTPLPVSQGVANRSGLMALARPGGLGDFKVLVQGKALPPTLSNPDSLNPDSLNPDSFNIVPHLWGLVSSPDAQELARSLPGVLLTDNHISLPAGWPQASVWEFEFTDLLQGPFGDT